jgi:hypothetical protein
MTVDRAKQEETLFDLLIKKLKENKDFVKFLNTTIKS